MAIIDIKVPDIGDFAEVGVIEVLVKPGADRDLVKVWQKMNAPRFDNIMLKTRTVGAKATDKGIEVTFE
ncbi:hypothetical protein, partial [Xylophilus sp. ASV27]|uniref:hypothetical protein n=1 Tax=Xylophilus sp. ASV27 TaxID=2795129 RepID=UPI0018ED8CDD